MMWMDIKIKGKIAVGHIMIAILPLLSRRMQTTLQRRYMDWLISAPVQKAMLQMSFCPTCRCSSCVQRKICVSGCGDCKLSWPKYKNMLFVEAAYTFDRCQKFRIGDRDD